MLLVPAARANPAKHQEAFIIKKKTPKILSSNPCEVAQRLGFFFCFQFGLVLKIVPLGERVKLRAESAPSCARKTGAKVCTLL